MKTPKDLEGRLIATHQGMHAIHKYLLRRAYGLDDDKLRWEGYPQEKLLGVLQSGKADAVVLLDQFFFRGEVAPACAVCTPTARRGKSSPVSTR